MCKKLCVLVLLALVMGLAHSFSWDIVLISPRNTLEFYDNETLTHLEQNFTQNRIPLITYDPGHNKVLFTTTEPNLNAFVYSFDITTRKLQHLTTSSDRFIDTLTYDLATDTLFWLRDQSIYSFSLKPGSINKVYGNFLTKLDGWPLEFVVDSCKGFIYWIYLNTSIKRSRLNGDDKECIINFNPHANTYLCGLTIDQQTRKLYWIANEIETNPSSYTFWLKSADLNGKNVTTLYKIKTNNVFCLLAVSNDFIYWGSKRTSEDKKSYWKLEKNPPGNVEVSPKEIATTAYNYMTIVANYATEDQTKGIQDCEALKSSNDSLDVSTEASLLCVHGTKVSGESVCECTQGYTGERCNVSVCQNYCVRGDCSVSAEGQPKCRCNAGYTGEICDVAKCPGDCSNNGACWSRNSLSSSVLIISIFNIYIYNLHIFI